MKHPKRKRWLAPVILITGFMLATILVISGEDEVPSGLLKKPMAVEVIQAQRISTRLNIPAWGLVEPRETVNIRPQVEGYIMSVDDHIVAGAPIQKDDVLFTIDPRDYQNSLQEAKATYEQARQDLEIEKGQQKIARAEYQLLQKNGEKVKNNALALRLPQLKKSEAALSMAKAKLEQAKLDLERTTLHAPCDGQIMEEHIAVGQYAQNRAVLLKLVCTDQYHIQAAFSPDYNVDRETKSVKIIINGKTYPAILKTVLPQIDPDIRQKQALVTLSGVILPLGTYAEVALPGEKFDNIFVLPKTALRINNTVWVLTKENTLDIRPVTLAAQNGKQVFISKGLKSGDQIILSHIASPLKGMTLRLPEADQIEDTTL